MTTTPLRQWVSTANANLKDKDDQDQVRFADLDLLKKINQVAIDAHTDIATLLGGVIIESGQNAYGFYQKFGDGTLRQRGWFFIPGTGGIYSGVKQILLPCPGVGSDETIKYQYQGYKASADPTNQWDRNIPSLVPIDIWTYNRDPAWFQAQYYDPSAGSSVYRLLFAYTWEGRWK